MPPRLNRRTLSLSFRCLLQIRGRMNPRISSWLWAAAALSSAFIFSCGGSVTSESSGGSSQGAGGTSGNPASCEGTGPACATSCGSDALVPPQCTDSGWQCPEGSINSAECPVGTCPGPLPACMQCTDTGELVCNPDLCIAQCPAIMCPVCPPDLGPIATDTCACACDPATNQYVCNPKPAPVCCVTDMDCGDFVYSPCVEGVCKPTPLPGTCWKNQDCPMGQGCAGVFVCPCGSDCDQPDKPGFCEGPKP